MLAPLAIATSLFAVLSDGAGDEDRLARFRILRSLEGPLVAWTFIFGELDTEGREAMVQGMVPSAKGAPDFRSLVLVLTEMDAMVRALRVHDPDRFMLLMDYIKYHEVPTWSPSRSPHQGALVFQDLGLEARVTVRVWSADEQEVLVEFDSYTHEYKHSHPHARGPAQKFFVLPRGNFLGVQ